MANGDRRGWLGIPAQLGLLAGLASVAPQLAPGTGVGLLFVLGTAVLALWVTIALHAWRQAARQRRRQGLPARSDGGLAILWLAPIAIVASSLFWGFAGRSADPGAVMDWYLDAWQEARPAEGIEHLHVTIGPGALADAWQRQESALHNELLLLSARHGLPAATDPSHPLRTVRWVDAGTTAAGDRLVAIELARSETGRGLLLGILPTRTQRLVTIARLGSVRLVRVPIPGPLPPGPWAEAWRIAEMEVAGITLGGP